MVNPALTRTPIYRTFAVTSLVLGGLLLVGDANFLLTILTSGKLLPLAERFMHIPLLINPLSPIALIGAAAAIGLGVAGRRYRAARVGVAMSATHIALGVAGFIFILWLVANAPWAR